MNNSVFSKTMKNLRKIIKVRLANNAKDFTKYTGKTSFVSHKMFKKNLVLIYEIKPILTLDNPNNVGSSTRDLSTFLMYKFH